MNRTIRLVITIYFAFCGLTSCVKIQEKFGTQKQFIVVVEDTIGEQYIWANKFCDSLNLPAVYIVNSNLSRCIEGIKIGEYDLLAKKIVITSDLREEVAFTNNLSIDKQVLIQRVCNDTTCIYIDDLIKMEGKRIYVTTASPSILRLENIQHEIGANFEIIETPYTQCDILLEQLSNGAIDYIACDYETAEEKVKQYPNLDIKTIISFSQFKAWAVNRDSTQLLNKLNDFLQKEISK